MKSLVSYFKNVRAELDHVVWPKPKTAVGHTILIIIISAATAAFIAALDYVFTNVVGSLLR